LTVKVAIEVTFLTLFLFYIRFGLGRIHIGDETLFIHQKAGKIFSTQPDRCGSQWYSPGAAKAKTKTETTAAKIICSTPARRKCQIN
jgi:hypothetical protein